MTWKHMNEWEAESGPKNGTEILVLKSDGERVVARFSGSSLYWHVGNGRTFPSFEAVAWDHIPDVPKELTDRILVASKARADTDALMKSPLSLT